MAEEKVAEEKVAEEKVAEEKVAEEKVAEEKVAEDVEPPLEATASAEGSSDNSVGTEPLPESSEEGTSFVAESTDGCPPPVPNNAAPSDTDHRDTGSQNEGSTDGDSAGEPPAQGLTSTAPDSVSKGEATAGPERETKPATGTAPRKASVASRGPLISKKARLSLAEERRRERREARHRKRQKLEQSFKDYFDYAEPLKRLPHYRVLAVNRGERCKVLRVKIQFDTQSLRQAAEQLIIPEGHLHAALLQDALQDTLSRLVIPSIEREVRRELTERAEAHAVRVFAQNLRKLLLQPPLWGRRVLAIDPGFRSGCKLAALDEFGNLLEHALIHVIGPADRVQQSRQRLSEMIGRHRIHVIALGNGTACRETEQFVAEVLGKELREEDAHYLIVNEAGASVYSTSQIGREELPQCDATVRGAVSIGRRALDPLSELVKIDPASIGVGLYQHDVKGKHLRDSLDAVVESCVNYVGVDVNSASPALLRYVSGLNQLTARRIYEYRQQHGPFRSREQLKAVAGVGDATFVQAAGFLKILDGENPLDNTWIHPESYAVAQRVLDELGCDPAALVRPQRIVPPTPAASGPRVESASPQPSADVPETPVATTEVASGDPPKPTETPTESAVSPELIEPSGDAPPAESIAEPPGAAAGESVGDVAVTPPAESSSTVTPPAGESETRAEGQTSTPSEPVEDAGSADVAPPAAASAIEQPPSVDDAAVVQAAAVQAEWEKRVQQLDEESLADRLSVGRLLLKDILSSLARPGRDPRDELPPPVFRREILKLEHLQPGMELSGTVLNVVDFGAFVDIGLSDSGLIHVSRLADRFVSDPHEVVSVGDVVNVWVVEVDEKRRRVSLTAIPPGTERPRPPKQERRPRGERPPAGSAGRKPRRERPRGKADRPAGKSRRPSGGWQSKPKVKAAPITKAMAEGREPMRTFSDLQQFFQRRESKPASPKSSETPPEDSSDSG